MQVKVLFFGVLTEVAGSNCKHYSEVKSIGDLKQRVINDFPEVVNYNYSISLNNVIINDDPNLKNGDEIALLPPFAGG